VDNRCEFRAWIYQSGRSHCVNPGFSGFVPGGFHFITSLKIGRLTGDC
jgi:hypothetical protein